MFSVDCFKTYDSLWDTAGGTLNSTAEGPSFPTTTMKTACIFSERDGDTGDMRAFSPEISGPGADYIKAHKDLFKTAGACCSPEEFLIGAHLAGSRRGIGLAFAEIADELAAADNGPQGRAQAASHIVCWRPPEKLPENFHEEYAARYNAFMRKITAFFRGIAAELAKEG